MRNIPSAEDRRPDCHAFRRVVACSVAGAAVLLVRRTKRPDRFVRLEHSGIRVRRTTQSVRQFAVAA